MAKMALGSRPKDSYEKKLVGVVDIVTGETKAKLTLTEEGKKFSNGKESITVLLEDLPSVPVIPTNMKEAKQYRVRMNTTGDEVEAITPVVGHFTAKLVDLGKRTDKDSDPTPYERIFAEGTPKESRHFEFFAVYKIMKGAFKGVQLPAYNLHYKFEDDGNGLTQFAGSFENKKATRLFQLRDWMEVHKLGEEEIPWDDITILPVLLERALDNEILVDVIIRDGYVREVLPLQEEEDEAPVKKSKRSSDEIIEELTGEKPVKKNNTVSDELDVDKDFPKEETKKPAKRPAKKVVADEEDDL